MEGAVRVQILSQAGISEVPSQYIQPPENRPTPVTNTKTSLSCDNVPAIDLSHKEKSVIAAIQEACQELGAFHVINHGVPTKLMDDLRRSCLSFFNDFPMEDKLKYACQPNSAASQGYGSRMLVSSENDTVLDWRDYFDHHTLPLSRRNPSFWPHFPPEYRGLVADYSDEMKVLAQRLFGLISQSLGLKASCIEDAIGEFYQNITASYYPPCPQPELTLGLQSHSDMGAITLLIQDDVGGLQVLKDGKWLTVHPLPNAILVLLADQTEIITNGKYRSSVHQAVTNASKARLSIATFHDPAKAVRISPAADLLSESSPPRYAPVVYGDHVSSWYSKGPEGKRNLDALLLDT
ncbi:2-oxoglutarate and Fe(II)-dependent oxygenase superfamily protein isoform 1 [Theobroma cacao]|uniref:2-oxoglutarate and Fe(II)-dependent oxygenase superfamily protein isoform 1 n=1 Tax=Theobroma cacao TaxID=3641 RepID=A0A061F8V1_THECC|nr:2-oxoglutarate and Fe(II)-dependent oxygenase superfamily protein isoform 1 [Theobroma cacao]EOY13122.1 2-oxoglutarate and Fe(II)-dependent oxygenase superfamily protein isoform 1 [Theobroma cacao]